VRRLFHALAGFAVSLTLGADGLGAEIVVTSDGGVLTVTSYEAEGDWARLHLDGGGLLMIRLERIERVVDDLLAGGEAPRIISAFPFDLRFRDQQPVPDTPYGEMIWETARRHRVNPDLVAAMIEVESDFNAKAVSSKGARGLLQLMPGTAERFGIAAEQLYDPGPNLEAGVRYLAFLIQRFPGDLARILAAYNAGEAQVERYDGVPPFRETRDFIKKVSRLLGLATSP
jgi:hypothetical protein